MSRISKRKRIYMCMASVMCMLLLLIPLPVSANNQGSILLKATVEDEAAVYNLSNTEFTMYQVGIYKKNSWVLETEFAKSGVIFDFDDSSAQAEAAKKLEKYVQDNSLKGISQTTNILETRYTPNTSLYYFQKNQPVTSFGICKRTVKNFWV